jgi:hypothetical protein
VSSQSPSISAPVELADAFRSLTKRPFLVLLCLSYLLALVGTSIALQVDASSADSALSFAWTSNLIIDVLGIYLQIAVVLAAGGSGDPLSADPWMRAAFKHRCFWRYFAVTILEVLLTLIGLVGAVVGAFIVGGIVALAQPAVVLERLQPVEALRRSAAMTKPARRTVGIVFVALLLAPLAAGLVLLALGVDVPIGWELAISVVGATTSFTATIALTRIFVKLGGAPTPPVQTLLYKAAAPRPR